MHIVVRNHPYIMYSGYVECACMLCEKHIKRRNMCTSLSLSIYTVYIYIYIFVVQYTGNKHVDLCNIQGACINCKLFIYDTCHTCLSLCTSNVEYTSHHFYVLSKSKHRWFGTMTIERRCKGFALCSFCTFWNQSGRRFMAGKLLAMWPWYLKQNLDGMFLDRWRVYW